MMIRQAIGRGRALPLTTLLRQMHIGGGEGGGAKCGSFPLITSVNGKEWRSCLPKIEGAERLGPMLTQARPGILEIPMQSIIRPSIGIPPEMLRRSEYQTPVYPRIITPLDSPASQGNVNKEIQDVPDNPSRIEKQAARLIVIRRSKMNKHKLRKLRKKMKYVWAKVRLRRAIRKEKEYLNSKMELINAARRFDAKEYVAGIIKRAKEEPIPRKWTDPLMPEWFKEQEMKKEAQQKRYQKMINLYLNKEITIDFKDKKK